MKQTKILSRAIWAAIIAVIMCVYAASCAETQPEAPISEETTAAENNIQTAVYETKLQYYEAEIKQLSSDLLELKEQYYISNSESTQKINSLTQKVVDLEEQLKTVSVAKIKENARNVTTPSEKTDSSASTDKLSAEAKSNTSDYTYSETADGVKIEKYTGSDESVFIPSYINGKKVTAIGDNAFESSKITSVTIPDTVKSLGWFAFYCCSELKTVYIPSSVTSIEYGAFDYCDSKLTFHCPADSYAADYAASRAIKALY